MSWISFGNGFVAAGVLCAIVAICVFALRALERKSALFLAVFAAVSVVATLTAQKTNGVNNIPPQQMMMPGAIQGGAASCRASMAELEAPPPCGTPYLLGAMLQGEEYATVTADDIARGWRVESVTTNAAISYAMPVNGALVGNWHIHGASSSFGNNRIDFGDWYFPLGTNGEAFSSFWYFADGRICPTPKDFAHEICAVGAPMSAVPGRSRLWTAEEPDGARVLTWENFFLGGDTNAPINAQIHLYRNGDFTTRSNAVETVCRRVNPDDWDDDGIPNGADSNPMSCDGAFFGPANALPEGANTNAYCTVSVVATGPDALITFVGDAPSDYADPVFVAKSGETNEVVILIGKTYTISSEWPFDVVGASDPETEVWQMRSAAHQTNVRRPVTISASGGNPFTMSVNPSGLGGVFSWNAPGCCCSIAGSGDTFSWNCSTTCTCCGTYADGWYSYEGYWLPATSCVCGCWSDGTPDWVEAPGPLQPSVSVSFSKDVVIFEDAYENEPGKWVGRNSTRTRLNVVANGGPNGAVLSVESTNLVKLVSISGPNLPLSTVNVPAETQVSYSIVYEGVEASDEADDIAVRAVVQENGSGNACTNECAMTSVRLELAAVWEAPENPCTNRHVYGVGERVKFRTFPENIEASFALTRIYNDELPIYDNMISDDIYACPVFSATPNLKIVCREAEYRPKMAIVEPKEIVSPDAFWDSYYAPCLSLGSVGGTLLAITNYVGPMNVSFHGIMVSEIPCVHTNMPSGFFATTNYTGQWTHKYIFDDGWAMATRIETNNYWTVDRAGHPGTYNNWSAGRLVWDIPIGWVRMRFDGDVRHGVREEEHEGVTNKNTRALLIGGSQDVYQQIFSISDDGTASIEKHGHSMSRGRFCRIIVDGETIQRMH